MTVQEQAATLEDYLAAAEAEPSRRFELIHGRIEQMPPSSQLNTIIAGLIIHFLNAYVLPKGLGYVTVPDGGYQIAENTVYIPDAAFISKEQAGDLSGVVFPFAPLLAVEVVSPSESSPKVTTKVGDYLRAGAQLVWAIYPQAREVHVYTAGSATNELTLTVLTAEDTLTGGEVLPGFSVGVGELFPAEEE
jgi:Uma2 family endonuclease